MVLETTLASRNCCKASVLNQSMLFSFLAPLMHVYKHSCICTSTFANVNVHHPCRPRLLGRCLSLSITLLLPVDRRDVDAVNHLFMVPFRGSKVRSFSSLTRSETIRMRLVLQFLLHLTVRCSCSFVGTLHYLSSRFYDAVAGDWPTRPLLCLPAGALLLFWKIDETKQMSSPRHRVATGRA